VSFRLVVENQGEAPIDLRSITPRIPKGVELLETTEPSLEALKLKHSNLCEELTQILNDFLFTFTDEIADQYIKRQQNLLKRMFGSWVGPIKMYVELFSGRLQKSIKEDRKRWRAYKVTVETYAQSKAAFDRWLASAGDQSAYRNLFEEKLQQLQLVENQIGADPSTSPLATIEPKSFFAMTYVFRFARGRLDPRKYNISIEGSFAERGQKELFICRS
jgi:hypothetical protein